MDVLGLGDIIGPSYSMAAINVESFSFQLAFSTVTTMYRSFIILFL